MCKLWDNCNPSPLLPIQLQPTAQQQSDLIFFFFFVDSIFHKQLQSQMSPTSLHGFQMSGFTVLLAGADLEN